MKHFLMAFRPIAVDFLSTIVFIAIFAITGSVTVGIVVGMATGIGQIGMLLLWRKPVALMQWASLGLVLVMGTASLLTADPRFVMIKPSIGAAAIGAVMMKRGWQMRYFPPVVVTHVAPGTLTRWGYAWAVLQFSLALANLAVAYSFDVKTWAWFAAVIPLPAHLMLFLLEFFHIRVLVRRKLREQAGNLETPAAPTTGVT